MKNGINLSSSRSFFHEVPANLWWFVLIAILVASILHVTAVLRFQTARESVTERIEEGRNRLARLERELQAVRADLDTESSSEAIERLVALDRSGILTTVAPSAVLSEIARVLPDQARVVSVRVSARASEGELELDAVSADPGSVVAFLDELTDSALVRRAEMLEETPVAGGKFLYRIVAKLGPSRGAK